MQVPAFDEFRSKSGLDLDLLRRQVNGAEKVVGGNQQEVVLIGRLLNLGVLER